MTDNVEHAGKLRIVVLRYSAGTICLFIFLFFYVASAEFLQGLGDPNSKFYFNKPYFERYVVASGYTVLLILYLILQLFSWYFKTNKSERLPLYKCIVGKDEIYILKISFIYAFLYVAIGWLWLISFFCNFLFCRFMFFTYHQVFVLSSHISIRKYDYL